MHIACACNNLKALQRGLLIIPFDECPDDVFYVEWDASPDRESHGRSGGESNGSSYEGSDGSSDEGSGRLGGSGEEEVCAYVDVLQIHMYVPVMCRFPVQFRHFLKNM